MAKLNLTSHAEQSLRAMVARATQTGSRSLRYDESNGGDEVLMYPFQQFGPEGHPPIPCDVNDLKRFKRYDLVEGDGLFDLHLTQAAYDLVAAGFLLPDQPLSQVTNIGLQNTGTFHGHIVNANAGPHARAVQHVTTAADNADLLARLAQVTAELCEAVRATLPAAAADEVVAAAELARDTAGGPTANPRTTHRDAGDVVAGVLKNLATLGAAAGGAEKVGHLLTAAATFVYAHGAALAGIVGG